MRKRRQEQKCIINSEEKIFQIINLANQANLQVIESNGSSRAQAGT
jgi:hypothetical protein